MPKLNLSSAHVTQLGDWLNGGPTDDTGLLNWLANIPPGTPQRVIDQAQGEADLYQFLLDKDGKNVTGGQLSQQMRDALLWVKNSLDSAEAGGLPIPPHQEQMRGLWSFLTGI